MKKNLLIAALAITTILSAVYGFIQNTKYAAAEQAALKNLEMAISAEERAEANAVETVKQQKLVLQQKSLLNQALEDCKKKK